MPLVSNPIEQIMTVLNLDLQCTDVVRAALSDDLEKGISKCNNFGAPHKIAESKPAYIQSMHC